jgi:hypothetical protein
MEEMKNSELEVGESRSRDGGNNRPIDSEDAPNSDRVQAGSDVPPDGDNSLHNWRTAKDQMLSSELGVDRLAEIRRRMADGSYHSRDVAELVARQILARGDS